MTKIIITMLIVIIAAVNLLSACGPSGAVSVQERHCSSDLECDNGSFCHTKFDGNTCHPCTDCSKWKRQQPIDKCPKSKSECGGCESGFEDDGSNHCMPTEKTKMLEAKKLGNITGGLNPNKHGDPQVKWGHLVGFGIGIVLIAIFGFFGFRYYRNVIMKRTRNPSGESDQIPLKGLHETFPDSGTPSAPEYDRDLPDEYRNQPPAYTAVVDEKCQKMAHPFCLGTSYGQEAVDFLQQTEEPQTVPDTTHPVTAPAEEDPGGDDNNMYDENREADNNDDDVDFIDDDEGAAAAADDSHLSERSMVLVDSTPMEQDDLQQNSPPNGYDDDETSSDTVIVLPPSVEGLPLPNDERSLQLDGRTTRSDLSEFLHVELNFNLSFSVRASRIDIPPSLCSPSSQVHHNSRVSLESQSQNDSGLSNSNSAPTSPGGPLSVILNYTRVPASQLENGGASRMMDLGTTAFSDQRYWSELSTSQVDLAQVQQEEISMDLGNNDDEGIGMLLQQVMDEEGDR